MLMNIAFPLNRTPEGISYLSTFLFKEPQLTVSEWLLRKAHLDGIDIIENKKYIKEKLFEQMQFSATGKEFIEKDDGDGFIKRLEEIYQDTLKCLGMPVESFF